MADAVEPHSTDALPARGFPAHGRVVFTMSECCVVGDARGPFNEELVAQLQRLLPGLLQQLAGREWTHLCRFHESALCSPETLRALQAMLVSLAAAGMAPVRCAYVMGDDVEGASLMLPLFEQGFRHAGIGFAGFADEAAARAWLGR